MLGCCLVSFHFLWAILWPHPVQPSDLQIRMYRYDSTRHTYLDGWWALLVDHNFAVRSPDISRNFGDHWNVEA